MSISRSHVFLCRILVGIISESHLNCFAFYLNSENGIVRLSGGVVSTGNRSFLGGIHIPHTTSIWPSPFGHLHEMIGMIPVVSNNNCS